MIHESFACLPIERGDQLFGGEGGLSVIACQRSAIASSIQGSELFFESLRDDLHGLLRKCFFFSQFQAVWPRGKTN